MRRHTSQRSENASAGVAVLVVAAAVYAVAILFVALGNDGRIRYSADNPDTIPMWEPWLPAAVGIVLAVLVTPRAAPDPAPLPRRGNSSLRAFGLLGSAVAFTCLLSVLGPVEPRYLALKLTLLVLCPLVLFAVIGRTDVGAGPRQSWRPLIPAAGWSIAHLGLSWTRPTDGFDTGVIVTITMIAGGFLVNAVVEELFYRRWLQTAWARLLGGTWPAIVISAIAWASWHIAIQGTGSLSTDLANVVVNQGVTGLFLGFLWARYRTLWPLLVVHGLINANPLMFF